jgi:hypothetical protein
VQLSRLHLDVRQLSLSSAALQLAFNAVMQILKIATKTSEQKIHGGDDCLTLASKAPNGAPLFLIRSAGRPGY